MLFILAILARWLRGCILINLHLHDQMNQNVVKQKTYHLLKLFQGLWYYSVFCFPPILLCQLVSVTLGHGGRKAFWRSPRYSHNYCIRYIWGYGQSREVEGGWCRTYTCPIRRTWRKKKCPVACLSTKHIHRE